MKQKKEVKRNKTVLGALVIALTLAYLLVTGAVAQSPTVTSSKSTVTYSKDYLSYGDLWAFDNSAYSESHYADASGSKQITYYNSTTNTDSGTLSATISNYYATVTTANRTVPNGTPLHGYNYSAFNNGGYTKDSVASPVSETPAIPVLTAAAGGGLYSVVPKETGTYYVYVYSPAGAPGADAVKYAIIESADSNNNYAVPDQSLAFEEVGNGWYQAPLTINYTNWSAYSITVSQGNGTDNDSQSDKGTGTFSGHMYTNALLTPTTYYYNTWTATENFFETVLVFSWNNTVQLGPITKEGDSVTVNNGDNGTLSVQTIFGQEVAVGSSVAMPHMPLLITPEASGEYAFTGFEEGSVTSLNDGSLFQYDFEGSVTLTGKWEKMATLPTVTVSGGDVANLDFYYTSSGSSTIMKSKEVEYTFAVDFSDVDSGTQVSYTVTGDADSATDQVSGTLAANGTVKVPVCWYSVTVTFTCSDKTITYIITVSDAGLSPVAKIGAMEYLFIEDALAAAGNSDMVTVTADCSFYEGTPKDTWVATGSDGYPDGYTVKTGTKLLVPRSTDDTGTFSSKAGYVKTYVEPSEYRRLTVPNGINIYCLGSINVNGSQYTSSDRHPSEVTGSYGCIVLNGNAVQTQLYLLNGASLYCYGYITGSGKVEAQTGSAVYEDMQITDWRGGSNTSKWNSGSNRGFPFNQYYIQNVEAPIEFQAGCTANVSVTITASSISVALSVPYIGGTSDSGLFLLSSGSLTRTYISSLDRVEYDLNGKMSVGSISVSIPVMGTVDSADYVLLLNGNNDFNVNNGSEMTLDKNYAALPELKIHIKEGGKAYINGDMYLFDVKDWNQATNGGYTLAQRGNLYALTYSPTRSKSRTEYSRSSYLTVDGELIIGESGSLYTTNYNGSADKGITGTGTITVNGNQTTSQTLIMMGNNSISTEVKIPCLPALATQAGLSASTTDFKSLISGVYYGMSAENTSYNWYQWVVRLADTAVKNNYVPAVQAPCVGRRDGDDADVIGYTVNSANFKFTLNNSADAAVWYPTDGTDTETRVTPDSDGVFTITGITNDTTVDFEKVETYIAQIIGADGSVSKECVSLQEAVNEYTGTGYIKMINSSTESGFNLAQDVYLDLNGQTVTLTSELTSSSGKLYGMDSVTDGFKEASCGSLSGAGTSAVALITETKTEDEQGLKYYKSSEEYDYYRYVAVQDESGNYSFHHFNISVTGYRFELSSITPECALFFIGTFRGDSTAREYLKSVGFELSVFSKDEDGNTIETSLGKDSYTISGTVPPVPTDGQASTSRVVFQKPDAFLFEGYLIRAFSEENPTTYQNQFGAVATVTFDNNESWTSEKRKLSYLEAWQKATEISAEEKARLDAFLTGLQTTTE